MWVFFHGWRRKAGVVALVMACAMMGTWIRSLNHVDGFAVRFSDQRGMTFGTLEGGFYAKRYLSPDPDVLEEPPEDRFEFWTSPISDLGTDEPEDSIWNPGCLITSSDLKFSGFRYARFGINAVEILLIPYWSLVLPMTLLSAYLLLWKPRGPKTSATPENLNLNSN